MFRNARKATISNRNVNTTESPLEKNKVTCGPCIKTIKKMAYYRRHMARFYKYSDDGTSKVSSNSEKKNMASPIGKESLSRSGKESDPQ